MIEVVRYSPTGFTPHYQSYMADQIQALLNFSESEVEDHPDYTPSSRNLILQGYRSRMARFQPHFPLTGVHVFFTHTPDDVIAVYLNHLQGERPLRHITQLCDSTIAYALDEPYCQPPSRLATLHKQRRFGAYVPHPLLFVEEDPT